VEVGEALAALLAVALREVAAINLLGARLRAVTAKPIVDAGEVEVGSVDVDEEAIAAESLQLQRPLHQQRAAGMLSRRLTIARLATSGLRLHRRSPARRRHQRPMERSNGESQPNHATIAWWKRLIA
jgi:hypothetical protein